MPLQLTYRLGDVLTPDLLARHAETIANFFVFEHIDFDPEQLAETTLTERKLRELLEDLAAEQE